MNAKYIIELLDTKEHLIKDFTCGLQELDIYLKERASQETKKNITAVYILHEEKSKIVIGYYTLSSYSIELVNLPETTIKRLPKYPTLPVTLIGRFAVNSQFQGKNIGKHLLIDALVRSYKHSRNIASFAVFVDAKNEQSRSFYEKFGFKRSIVNSLKLYILMGTIKEFVNEKY